MSSSEISNTIVFNGARTSALVGMLVTTIAGGCGNDHAISHADELITAKIQFQQQPGEIVDCHVFKLDNPEAIDIDSLHVDFPEGSHHVHVYRTTNPEPDQVFDCFGGIDWEKWSLLIGAQTKSMDWELPAGITIPLRPHQQLLVQVHWLNSTDHMIEPTIDLKFHKASYTEQPLGVLFGVNQRINILPGQRVRVSDFCQIDEGANLLALMGHFHQHGRDYRVTERMPNQTEAQGKIVYQAPDEPAFEFKRYDPPHAVAPGAGLEYGCGFFNYGGQTITWGPDTKRQEHCNMTTYFYPATHLSTLCLLKPPVLSALTPDKPNVRAGDTFTVDLELAAPAAADFTVALSSSDPMSLELPASVMVPTGATRVSFTANARRPAQVDVTAAVPNATLTQRIRVTGLILSELFYKPATATSPGRQWVELANQTNAPIDLSGYSFGAGDADYMRTRTDLPLTIPARSCVVIGGPTSGPENHSPVFDLAVALSPELGAGGTVASGFGLFAAPVSSLTKDMTPLDQVAYAGNTTQLAGANGERAPVWPGTVPGGSLQRVSENVWVRSAAPTPGICEVLSVP